MSYDLTENQKQLARWIVQQVLDDKLHEEFLVMWKSPEIGGSDSGLMYGIIAECPDHPEITPGLLDALAEAGLLLCKPSFRTTTEQFSGTVYSGPTTTQRDYEINRTCTLKARAYEAIDSDFASPDTSFVTHLAPLADVTNLDSEIKTRCLPILGAGGSDPKLWDSAVRTAGVILEEHLHDVGGITDSARTGRDLVNDVFGNQGTLAGKFSQDSERQGYRDLYAGIVGALRNPYAHRLIDPTPEVGGVIVVFVDLLLKMLDDLR